jgi:hypothetical protein
MRISPSKERRGKFGAAKMTINLFRNAMKTKTTKALTTLDKLKDAGKKKNAMMKNPKEVFQSVHAHSKLWNCKTF